MHRIQMLLLSLPVSPWSPQKLETATPEQLTTALEELLPRCLSLMTDVFGNYVVQKFLEHGGPEQRAAIAGVLKGQVCAPNRWLAQASVPGCPWLYTTFKFPWQHLLAYSC